MEPTRLLLGRTRGLVGFQIPLTIWLLDGAYVSAASVLYQISSTVKSVEAEAYACEYSASYW